MKFILNLIIILIILLKTGNVLSDEVIFNVNNIELNKEFSKNKEKLANEAFKKGFEKLTNRLLLEKDYKKIANTRLNEIKNLISYYQIAINNEDKNIIKPNYQKEIRGMGMERNGRKGSLVIRFNVVFPENLTSDQVEKLKEIL